MKTRLILGVSLLCSAVAAVFAGFWASAQPEVWYFEALQLVLVPTSFICALAGIFCTMSAVGEWAGRRE